MSGKRQEREDEQCCGSGQDHQAEMAAGKSASGFGYREQWKPAAGLILLTAGLILDHFFQPPWFSDPLRFLWYLGAYLPVGLPVLNQALVHLKKGEIFTEFFLMGIATLGAFFIGEYPEGVGVMLFYSIGEVFQNRAVHRARESIKALLDIRAESAHVKRGNALFTVHPATVKPGEIIQVKPGERVPLDGYLLGGRTALDTSALTGESRPRHYDRGDRILAGMISLSQVTEIEVSGSYENSAISRILELVQDAASRKAKTEQFIRSFARIYTPAVVFLASLLVVLPAVFVNPYLFEDWLYRGLVFLVISCPCALVISIPLGYFGGIGAASRNGILIKGSNYLDALTSVTTVVFDKTGTLTRGTYSVQNIRFKNGKEDEILSLLLAVERSSTHPVAKAITDYTEDRVDSVPVVEAQTELPGYGVQAYAGGKKIVIGSRKLMEKEGIELSGSSSGETGTTIHVAVDGIHEGTIEISDEIRDDAAKAVEALRSLGVSRTVMLSGDRDSTARSVGKQLNIDHVYAGLLPGEKARKFEELKERFPGTIVYAGDGINDAPVLALSDVGIAMGAMGSDVAVESADVVIQTDQLTKIATVIRIGRATRNIVWQNITLAMGVKVLVLGAGALGLATLWGAVFADVGVALLAVLNAVRIQKMDFSQDGGGESLRKQPGKVHQQPPAQHVIREAPCSPSASDHIHGRHHGLR